MPKIRSTQRTVQVSTPRLTPPSTAGFGASGRATQQLGNEISKFAGVFDAFAKAEEKNQAANLQSDFYQLQIDSDKQLADFGNEHKGDGNSYFQGAGSIFDNNGQKFVDKYSGNSKLQTRAKTMVQGAKVQYQRKAIAKGQQIQHDRAIIKSTEISASIRGGMLTPENLKEGGIGIVREASDKYFKIVDGLPLSETAKMAAKQNFVKRSAKDVEQFADTGALMKWRDEIGKKLEKEGGQKETSNLTPDEVKRLEQETGLKKGSGEHLEDRGWPVEHNDPRAKKYRKIEGEILSSKVTTKISVNLPKNNVGKALHEASTKHNLDPGLVGQIAKIESNYNPNAKNPRSSARGLGQFINSTARRYGLKNDGTDSVEAQATALAAYTRDNISGFKAKVGRDPSPGEVYLAHFAGLGRAIAIGRAPANARISSILSQKAINANKSILQGKTVGQVRAWAARKMGSVKPVVATEPQSLDMQIAGAINWKNVEKRHEAEVTQQVVQQVKGKPAVEQELMRDTLHDLQEKSPQNKEVAIRLKAVEDYQKKQTKGLKNDPLKFADDEGVVDVPSLIGQKDIMKSIGERVDLAHKVSDIYQTEPRYLRQEEKAFISKHVNELPANEKLEFLALLDKGAKGKTSKILSELNDVDPNLAHVGGLMLSGRNEAATLAMQGMDIMADKSLKAVTESIKTSDVTAAFNEVIGNAFGPDTIKAAGPFIGTAKAIAATLMVQGGKTSQEAIEEGLRMATGQKEIDGEQYGGVIEFNDQKILIHPDHKADDVLNLFDLLTSGSTESQAGRGVIKRSLFSDPRGAFDFFLRKDGINPTSPVTHRPVTAEDMHDAQFVSVGPGKVLILIDGVPLKDTRSAQNLGNGMQAYTQDYVLDLSQNLGELVDLIDLER